METSEETEPINARVEERVGLRINSQCAVGHVELVRTLYGTDLVLDGQVLLSLDLYYRSREGRQDMAGAVRDDCAILCLGFGEHQHLLNVYMTRPDPEGRARMILVRETPSNAVEVHDDMKTLDRWAQFESLVYKDQQQQA